MLLWLKESFPTPKLQRYPSTLAFTEVRVSPFTARLNPSGLQLCMGLNLCFFQFPCPFFSTKQVRFLSLSPGPAGPWVLCQRPTRSSASEFPCLVHWHHSFSMRGLVISEMHRELLKCRFQCCLGRISGCGPGGGCVLPLLPVMPLGTTVLQSKNTVHEQMVSIPFMQQAL